MRRHRVLLPIATAAALLMATRAAAVAPAFPGIVTTTIASADEPATIPDNDSLLSTLLVGGLTGKIVDVDVTLDVTHTQSDQLDITLVAPSGTTITLTTDNGGANDNVFHGVVFDDQASGTPSAPNVRNFTYVDNVPVGTIQPEEALGALAGEDPNGLWALVVVDDTGGQTGMLNGWSLTISTVPAFNPSPPVTFQGAGANLPNGNLTGFSSPVAVSGLGTQVLDVNVTVDVTSPRSADIDLYLTSPGGRRIDLVTRFGGANANLYAGTTFDDQAGTPIGDLTLPPSGTAFTSVVPEGALSAFLGEDPNGTWTLTAVDDTGGNASRLNGWTLAVSASSCGDGHVDAGEQCDDGNQVSGDGCEPSCTLTPPGGSCPGGCAATETDCGNCIDDDGNGLVDALDPACQPGGLRVDAATVTYPRGLARGGVRVIGGVASPAGLTGPVSLALADGNGAVACAVLGTLQTRGRNLVAKGPKGTLKVHADGRVLVRGAGLDLSALDDPTLAIGLRLGSASFASTTTLQQRGHSRRAYP